MGCLLLFQMVNPNIGVWASQDPSLLDLSGSGVPCSAEGSGDTLGSGLVTALSSTVLLLSPGRSCHFGHCTIPTEALLCRTLDNVWGLPGINLAGEDKDHQVPI